MPLFPAKPGIERVQTSVPGLSLPEGELVRYDVPAAKATVASNTGIHAAVTDNGSQQVVTTGITQPSVPRNITATAGGTATDIKAISVTIDGTDFAGNALQEVLPAFTVDTAGTKVGTKAFKTVTKITIPAHDGTGATTAIGFGEVLGLPSKLAMNTVLAAGFGGVREATAPTVTVNAGTLALNTVDLNSALDGAHDVSVWYIE